MASSDRKDGAEEHLRRPAPNDALCATGTVECSDYAGAADDEAQTVGPGSLVECEAQPT